MDKRRPTYLTKAAYDDIIGSFDATSVLAKRHQCSIKYVQAIQAKFRETGRRYPYYHVKFTEEEERAIAFDERQVHDVAVSWDVGMQRVLRLRDKYKVAPEVESQPVSQEVEPISLAPDLSVDPLTKEIVAINDQLGQIVGLLMAIADRLSAEPQERSSFINKLCRRL